MYKIKLLLWITGYLFTVYAASAQNIKGELKKWHKVTLSFEGPQTSETATKNPFTDYRLDVTFSNGNKQYKVPGYFAADGNAANTSATSGNVWRVHFAPDETGTWTYEVSFKTGNDVAINGGGASAGFMDGRTGNFNITPSDKSGRDHRAKGRLKYVGEHYLQFAETGEWFVKAGADAPENKLSYVDFDDTPKAKKDWAPHLQDYVASDAADYTWKNGRGKGLLGAVAYLSNKGVNAFSFLTFSLDGDDKTVFPHLGKVNEVRNWKDVYRDRFDVSKLDQWGKIFEYADKKGMYLHFKTQETENDQIMDDGDVGRERKIYYRELIARYAHHLALNWNLGEENSQTTQQERDMAQYFYDNDPYEHTIVMHTYPGQKNKYQSLLGNQSKLTGASLQTSNPQFSEVFDHVDEWVRKSAAAGKKWVVAVDEPGNASIGTHVDPNDRKLVRHKVVWATLMAGGTGVEFYYGYQSGCSDLTCEDHRTRDQKYTDAAYALKFFQQYFQKYLPDVVNDNQVTSDGSDYVLRNTAKNAYAVYLPNGGSTGISLPGSNWELQWYNPRNGQLQNASAFTGNTLRSPSSDDWVALLTSDGSVAPEPETDPDPVDCNTVINLDATIDFSNINVVGFAPAYKDNSRDALAVDAAQYKDQYAAAQTTFQGPSGTYDISLNTLMERDGESTYKLYVGGALIGTYANPASAMDYLPAGETWNDIAIQNGALIQVEFNTATNQQVQEGSGYGYSRGRWQSLVLTCTREDTTSQPDPIPDPHPNPEPDPDPCLNNSAPKLEILQPGNNTKYEIGTDIVINAEVIDVDGKIEALSFYLNDKMIEEDKTAPYSVMLTKALAGSYELYAVATDNCKATTQSSTISYTVSKSEPEPDTDPTPDTTQKQIVLSPIHDAYLQNGKRYNIDELRAELNKRTTYLMFDLSEVKGKILDAKLQLTIGSDPGYGEITICEGSHNNWAETDIIDANKPQAGSLLATRDQMYEKGDRIEWNLGKTPYGSQLSFVVSHLKGNDVSFISKEHNNKAGIPKLMLTVETVVDTLEDTPILPEEPVDTTKVNPDPLPVSHVIPGIIQAEDFDDQQGIRTQATADEGAGENIGWIQNGDYTSYNVYVETTAVYTATFRVASATQGGNVFLYSDDQQVASVAIENTSGWQSWQSVSVEVNLEAGNQTLKMLYEGGNGYLLNVNWVSFEVGEITPDSDPTNPCANNKAPTVAISEPVQTSFIEGSTIEFLAEAKDEEGSIKTVEFIFNGKSVQMERVIPYTYSMSNAQAGSHEMVAVVTDGCDVQTRSVAFKFQVTSTQQDDPIDPVPPVTDCKAFAEKDGILIMEAESLPIQAPWVKKNDNLASGGTYIQWTGGNSYGKADTGITNVSVAITKTGKYRFLWRMRQPDDVRSDLSNDSWINFPDTKFMDKDGKAYKGFIKIFGNGKGDFAWRATADVNHQKSPVYVEFTQPGTYTFQLAGRSDLHQIDRIVLFHESLRQSDATDISLPETRCNSQLRLVDANADFPDEEGNSKTLKVYPNPASSELYIDGEELEFREVRIFDMTGREVIRELYSLPLDISNLSPGLYHVLVGDYQTKRFVKK